MSSPAEDGRSPRVLMLLGADVMVDARVQKSATTLAEAGADVTVLFHAKRERDFPTHLGAVRIEHVPVGSIHLPRTWSLALRDAAATLTSSGGYASMQRRRRAVHRRKLAERRAAGRIAARKVELRRLQQRPADDPAAKVLRRLRSRRLLAAIELERFRTRAWRRTQRSRIARTEAPLAAEEFPFQPATELSRADLRQDWRRALPDLADLELAFGPRIDAIGADVLHVHDYHLLPAAIEASQRAEASGRDVTVIYDAHEYVRGLTTLTDERRRALAAMEARFLPAADAIVTVSEALAARLVDDHGCPQPTVVLNAPYRADAARPASRSLRTEAGVPEISPLVVYSGNVTPARGVHTLVDALAHLPDEVHVALVVGDRVPYLEGLLARAVEQGTAERLHLAPYVPAGEVPAYLSGATLGVHPLRHYPNAEIALPNKLFEYIQAAIPIVVSDCEAQAGFVRQHGIGEVFRAEDPADLAARIRDVLADPDRYLSALDDDHRAELSWEGQEAALLSLYRRLNALPQDAGQSPASA